MLSPAQLTLIRTTISNTIFNRQVTITDAAGSTLQTGVLCYIAPDDSPASLQGQDIIQTPPVDGRLQIERNDFVKPGNKILITSVNGSAATASQSALYSIQSVSDLDGIGIIQECTLFRESGVVG